MAFDVASTIKQTADQYGVDPDFALKVAQAESNLNPSAVSPKGAQGVMQLTPPTAKDMGVDIHDVRENIVGGVKRLRQLQDRYGGDHQLIAAAYNAGPTAVDKHGGVPPYPETQDYVAKVTGQDPRLPTPDAVLKSIGYTPNTSAQTPGATAPAPDALPSPAEVLKSIGYTPALAGPEKPVSPAQAKANADEAKSYSPTPAGSAVGASGVTGFFHAPGSEVGPREVQANAFGLNLGPVAQGAVNAVRTGAQNAMAGVGIGKPAGYGMGEAYTAGRDAYQGALDTYKAAHPVVGTLAQVVGFGGSLPAAGIERLTGAAITKAAPRIADSLAGRLALGGVKAGAVGAAAGGGQAASEGGDAGDIAKGAAIGGLVTAPLGVAGEALRGVPLPKSLPRGVVLPAAGALAGGAVGYATGGKAGAVQDAAIGAGLGLHMGRRSNAEVTPQDRATALDLVRQSAPDVDAALSGASPHATAAEALGASGQSLVQKAAQGGEGAVTPLRETLATRGEPNAVLQRLSGDVQQATGIDPATAHADITAQVDAARKGPAKQAYDAALSGKPVWTPELAELSKEPEVRGALDKARRLMGAEGMVDNPAAKTTDTGAAIISPQDYVRYLKTGDESILNGGQPQMAPTDKTWDLAKQLLDKSVSYNAFGKPETSTENHMAQAWSGRLRDALDTAIPGYSDARAVAGDYLSAKQAYSQGQDLWSSSRPDATAATFAKRFEGLTPAQQQAMRTGYLSTLYSKLENGKFDPKQITGSPFHQGALRTMFGADRASSILSATAREQALSASAKATMSSAKAPAVKEDGHGVGPAAGAALGFVEGGLHGAAKGALGGAALSGARGVFSAMREGRVTPQVRTALGDILAGNPADVAAELKASRRPKEVKLSESAVGRQLARGALRGVATTAGTQVAHALAGVPERE